MNGTIRQALSLPIKSMAPEARSQLWKTVLAASLTSASFLALGALIAYWIW